MLLEFFLPLSFFWGGGFFPRTVLFLLQQVLFLLIICALENLINLLENNVKDYGGDTLVKVLKGCRGLSYKVIGPKEVGDRLF